MAKVRETISYTFLGLYILYGLFGIGMTGLLFSFAIGLITLSLDQPVEICVAITILAGLFFKGIMGFGRRRGATENFQVEEPRPLNPKNNYVPVGMGDNAADITKKVETIQNRNVFQPSGVLSSSFAEGFADVPSTETAKPNAGSLKAEAAGVNTAPPADSTPAAAAAATTTNQLAAALPNPANSSAPAPGGPTPTGSSTSGFTSKATDGQFKLGSIPADKPGGDHIDVGTTLMNALNSLKPDQVKQMTEDTKKLMDTQKSLMSMLSTMKPMMQDGKQLMETFTEMFGQSPMMK
jgi:hypothetical protein